MRLTIRSVVVLPQPDGPTITVIWPDGTTRLRFSTAVVPSRKVLETDSNSITRNPCYLVLVGLDAPAGRDHDWPVARAANLFDPRRPLPTRGASGSASLGIDAWRPVLSDVTGP